MPRHVKSTFGIIFYKCFARTTELEEGCHSFRFTNLIHPFLMSTSGGKENTALCSCLTKLDLQLTTQYLLTISTTDTIY